MFPVLQSILRTVAAQANLYAEYIMRNTGLDEAQVESRLPGEITITSDMQITPPLWQKAKKTKEPLDKSERGE